MSKDVVVELTRSALDALEEADPQPIRRMLATDAGASVAARAALFEAGQPDGAFPRPAELEELTGDMRVLGAASAVRLAVLRLDRDLVRSFVAIADQAVVGSHFAGVLRQIALGWGALAAGTTPADEVTWRSLEADARAVGAGAVLEVGAIRALLTLERLESVAEGVRHARRASLMARTESRPVREYLAGIVLSRARRMAARPHAAVRILTSLVAIAPPAFHPWLDHELAFSGARPLTSSEAPTRLVAWAALDWQTRFALEGRDVILPADMAVAVERFADGSATEAPRGVAYGARGGPGPSVFVLAPVGAPPRRILGRAEGVAPTLRAVRGTGGAKPRIDAALARLALAGPAGIRDADLFQSVYGFAYAKELHQGILDVLLHRVRAALDGAGTIHRDGPHVTLQHDGLVVTDDRAVGGLEDRILAALAAAPHAASARTIAEQLGVPLRTVQETLRRLHEEGICRADRRGRNVDYVLEDTTFAEPTRAR